MVHEQYALCVPAFAVTGTELVPLPQPGSGMTPMGNWYQPPPPSRLVFVHPGGGTPYSNDSDICANAAPPHADKNRPTAIIRKPRAPHPVNPRPSLIVVFLAWKDRRLVASICATIHSRFGSKRQNEPRAPAGTRAARDRGTVGQAAAATARRYGRRYQEWICGYRPVGAWPGPPSALTTVAKSEDCRTYQLPLAAWYTARSAKPSPS